MYWGLGEEEFYWVGGVFEFWEVGYGCVVWVDGVLGTSFGHVFFGDVYDEAGCADAYLEVSDAVLGAG